MTPLSIINPDLQDSGAEMKAQKKTLKQSFPKLLLPTIFPLLNFSYDTSSEHGISSLIRKTKSQILIQDFTRSKE